MTGQLDHLLERRRKACEEFESQPIPSTADAGNSSKALIAEPGIEVGSWLCSPVVDVAFLWGPCSIEKWCVFGDQLNFFSGALLVDGC